MSHDDFAFEPARGLPAPLPAGERLLWQGSPQWKSHAFHAYHVRKVALYFLALMLWDVVFGIARSHSGREILVPCVLLLVAGSVAVALLSLLAYCSSRSTVYSITSRRVLLRHGIAVPMTMNIPFTMIDAAALKVFANGTGDIALNVPRDQRVGYLITWPHLRPGHITRPQPSLRSLSDGTHAAEILGSALAADAGAADVAATVNPAAPANLGPATSRPLGGTPVPGAPRHPAPQPAARPRAGTSGVRLAGESAVAQSSAAQPGGCPTAAAF